MSAIEQLVVPDPELAERLRKGMAEVETRLRETATDSPDPLIGQAAGYLLDAGGKRWRPLLVLLGAQFGDPERASVLDAAVVVELIHAASLHHDDVMDEAPLRHGVPSAHLRWNNKIAILVGDHLVARGATLSVDLDEAARRMQAQAFERLVRGQVREVAGPRPGQDPVEHHLEVVGDKSASLIALAVRLGGICAGADAATVAALGEYGEALGVAFQLSDDVIDIVSGADRAGKAAGTDLRAGVMTLPALLAVREGGRLGEILATGPVEDADLRAEALALLRSSPGLAAARAEVARYAGRARAAALRLPDGPARRVLEPLCDLVASRSS
ncbi:geranylgeranyl pyrophosphate synthase [Sphaerisporangium melleum]|uniref:Geranylgeranyl pyrophosphate synthase n=1 Tax=Sphaerisporangium melleum TaxID=321316 RepID=A0A917QSM7_9ACTN|nr:polyprenyl synthetase family protein [Sphaerisporangium melleum]GGK65427.1 geranylgeranyl pyrophosphate synthase [Sphaerisporangium melleum]GII69958.1 geranylgeranyl pyrophosphate synthase [Sphaerisporangium melleum]